MKNVKVVLEYEGTGYSGFQVQANAVTIQERVEAALKTITGETIRIVASGRTDAGVHARGQVISFNTSSSIPPDRFAAALNSCLPSDIRALESSEQGPGFHARFSAKEKTYRYLILNRSAPSALLRNLAYWIPDRLDLESMSLCARDLVGTHDFRAFMSSGSSAATTVRTVTFCQVSSDPGDGLIHIIVSANGFLYNMVRIIVGTLVEVGKGRLQRDVIRRMLECGDRGLGGPTAPARGLYLEEVRY